MTATRTETGTVPSPAGPAIADPPRPSLGRLALVELRKITDTRSGRWILIVIALSNVVMMPVMLATMPEQDQSLRELFVISQLGASLLLPVLGILAVTSEWSQRTALTTYALVPDRHRVLAAKLAGLTVLATLFTAFGLLVAALTRGLGGLLDRSSGSWTVSPGLLGTVLLSSVLLGLIGVAFGLALNSPALSIVLFFVLPTAWSVLNETIKKIREPAGWLDFNRAMEALTAPGVTAGEWARLGTSMALWLLLPLLIGLFRLARREVK